MKNVKRILSMLLVLIMLLGMLAVTAQAATKAAITSQPKSVTVENGQVAKTTVKATGDGLTYQWYIKNPGKSSFSKSSVTSATYSTTMKSTVSGRQAYCVVKDKYGNKVKTNTVTLKMGVFAKITSQPKSVTVAKGQKVTVSLKAVGDGLTYTWYYKNKGASSFSKTDTFTGNTYSISSMSASRDGRQVYCVVKDKYGNSVKSNGWRRYRRVLELSV